MTVITRLQELGFPVVTRAEWGTRHAELYAERLETHPFPGKAKCLFGHITVTFDTGMLTGDFYKDMRTVERIGYERFGSGFSYNWAIDFRSGLIGEGQPLGATGTHTVNVKNVPGFPHNLNKYGHAVAMLGMPGDIPSEDFHRAFAAIMRAEADEGWLSEYIAYPHSKFAYKKCPTAPVANKLPLLPAMAKSMEYHEGDPDMDATEKARLEWIYKANIDGDGTPSTNTMLGRVLAELESTNARLATISKRLDTLENQS